MLHILIKKQTYLGAHAHRKYITEKAITVTKINSVTARDADDQIIRLFNHTRAILISFIITLKLRIPFLTQNLQSTPAISLTTNFICTANLATLKDLMPLVVLNWHRLLFLNRYSGLL